MLLWLLVCRSSSRCGSLDLEWPSSPCEPSTAVGRDGSLSPVSQQFAEMNVSHRKQLRLQSCRRAAKLYAERISVLGPSALDVITSLNSDAGVSIERQSLR